MTNWNRPASEGPRDVSLRIAQWGGDCSLAFLHADGSESFTIGQLTEGEVCWLADVLFRAFPRRFAAPIA
jgi:hypothetical protein